MARATRFPLLLSAACLIALPLGALPALAGGSGHGGGHGHGNGGIAAHGPGTPGVAAHGLNTPGVAAHGGFAQGHGHHHGWHHGGPLFGMASQGNLYQAPYVPPAIYEVEVASRRQMRRQRLKSGGFHELHGAAAPRRAGVYTVDGSGQGEPADIVVVTVPRG